MAESVGAEKMIEARVLALCGKSLLIEGIKASLRNREGVEVVLLDTSQPGAIQDLDKLSPDIVVFDMNPSQFNCVFTFLQTHTDVFLIGLDIACDKALFLSGKWRVLPTLADFMRVIDARIQLKRGRQL